MEILAIVPARGGSKSIARKNLRSVAGRTLVEHSIACALSTELIDRVLVSTDDEEIAGVARAAGADVPFLRPAELATDDALDIGFHAHALRWLSQREGYLPDAVVNLRPTHPVRRPSTVDAAIRLLLDTPGADAVRSMRLADQTPFKMWRIDRDGFAVPVVVMDGVREPYNMPRQALPDVFWQDGYVDVVRASVVLQQDSTTGSRILPFLIDEPSVDIDYPEDLVHAERLLEEARQEDRPATSDRRHPS